MPFQTELSWLQKHERLIIVLVALVLGGWLTSKWIDSSAARADLKQAVAIQQLTEAKNTVTELKAQADKAAQQFQATIDALTAQNNALAGAVAQRNTTLKAKQAVLQNQALPLIVQDWKDAIKANDSDFTNITSDSVNVSSKAATQTVIQLEEVPVLQANVTDTQAQVDNYKKALDTADGSVIALGNEIDGLNNQISKQDAACKAQVDAVKADARKSKKNWFLRGMVVGAGIVGYIALHF